MLKWTISGKVMLCACLFVLYDWIGLYFNFLYCILFSLDCILLQCILLHRIALLCIVSQRPAMYVM